jgi:hypothetical protein
MARHARTDNDFLAMALVGYETEKAKIDAAIADLRARVGQPSGAAQSAPTKRTMSAAARRRIAAAQRKRWAAVKKNQPEGKSAAKAAAPKKRKLSAAARKRMADATRKRWAAYRKASGKKAKPEAKAAKAAVHNAATAATS